jgi:hypothetical protein
MFWEGSPTCRWVSFHGLRASLAGRRIVSTRVRTGLTGPARRQRPPQQCDASGPRRPTRPIPGLNLRQVCVDPDADGLHAHPS